MHAARVHVNEEWSVSDPHPKQIILDGVTKTMVNKTTKYNESPYCEHRQQHLPSGDHFTQVAARLIRRITRVGFHSPFDSVHT